MNTTIDPSQDAESIGPIVIDVDAEADQNPERDMASSLDLSLEIDQSPELDMNVELDQNLFDFVEFLGVGLASLRDGYAPLVDRAL